MAKIILVDDEQLILRSIGLFLKTEGHDVSLFSDGQEALDALESASYDLLITDIRMSPVNGLQLLRAAKRRSPTMPCIVISALSSSNNIDECRKLGCSAFLSKPFNIDKLVVAVKEALAHPQISEEPSA